MSVFDPYVERFVPGRAVDNTGGDDDEGPVTSVVGETHYVSYVVLREPEDPGGHPELSPEEIVERQLDRPPEER